MEFQLIDRPEYTAVRSVLDTGESLITEAGAMLGMSGALKMETNMRGGFFAAAKRKLLGGESLFMNTYTAEQGPARLDFAPAMPGDIEHRKLDNESLLLQSSAFLACTPGITLNTQWGGARGFFGGPGLFLLKVEGSGDLFFSSYGAIQQLSVSGSVIIDTGHIVAFEPTLEFQIRKIGSMKSLFLSGEGLVCEFSGHGTVWIQTRAPEALASFLHPFRRVKTEKN